jgi:glycerol-3-phosphate acyltransferase PlsY
VTPLFLALGYLAGSIPFGVVVTRLLVGKDVRSEGSGNIGATNVTRVAGKKVGALVLLLDAAKGALPVWLVSTLEPATPWLHVGVAAAAFVGHVFPVWLKFRGGKGVATALGVLTVLLPWSALVGFLLWAGIVLATRLSSLGSLVGAVAAIAVAFISGAPPQYAGLAVGLLVAMVWTHRGNILRLIRRQENRV